MTKEEFYAWFQTHWDWTAHALLLSIIVKIIMLLTNVFFAVLIGAVVGLYKEYKIDNSPNTGDIIADIFGIILGIL